MRSRSSSRSTTSCQVEGWAREIVRAIQRARQDAGLEVTDRIALTLDGDDSLLDAARAHEDYIAGETLAVRVSYESLDGSVAPVDIDGRVLRVAVALACARRSLRVRPQGELAS